MHGKADISLDIKMVKEGSTLCCERNAAFRGGDSRELSFAEPYVPSIGQP